jgi:hypothetical protein
MKNFIKILPVIFCFLLMAAHFGRANILILQVVSLIIPFLLFWKNRISVIIIQTFLVISGFEWIRTLVYYAKLRAANGEAWLRLAIILGVVALLNFGAVLIFRSRSLKESYRLN